MSENEVIEENPWQKDVYDVNEGANWLANWITERYNLGYLEKDAYEQAILRIKNTKVYFTDKGYDKVVEELQSGKLHLTAEAVRSNAHMYDRVHKDDISDDLTLEQKAIAYFKEAVANSYQDSNLGFHVDDIQEPAVFLNVKRQHEYFGKYVYCPSITSLAVHELTHQLRLTSTEQNIQRICVFGENYNPNSRHEPPSQKAKAPEIALAVSVDESANSAIVSGIAQNQVVDDAKPVNNGGFRPLREGISRDVYLDNQSEIYARLMQLRYTYKLKPDEEFTDAQIEEIEKRAIEAREKSIKGENPDAIDVDFFIIERYKNGYVKSLLNNTAENREDGKKELKMQRTLADYMLAKAESKENNSIFEKDEERKGNNQPLNIADKFDNIRS